jgi:hypothetical protein
MERLGPFQRKARNMGIDRAIVARLPWEWPLCSQDGNRIEDVLYDAGYPPGVELLETARLLWRERPSYRREWR